VAPICRGRKGELRLELGRLRKDGFVRARVDGQLVDLGDEIALDGKKAHDLEVVVDRVIMKDGLRARVTDSVELALKHGDGRLGVLPEDGEALWLSERFACVDCSVSLPTIEPRLFSFNGPYGACPACEGLGARSMVDWERLIGDPSASLRQGVVLGWGRRGSVALATEVQAAVTALGVNPDTAWQDLPQETRDAILFGPSPPGETKGRGRKKAVAYQGIVPRLEARRAGTSGGEGAEEPGDDSGVGEHDDLGRFVSTRVCASCDGRRLRPEALSVRFLGRNIAELGALPLSELVTVLGSAGDTIGPRAKTIAEPLLRAVVARLGFLIDVGLDYLSLDRSAKTLSSGEGQRIRLATQIGAALVGVLYVLDEPSVGLHARDNERLLAAEAKLRDLGNSVLVVEHDREAILAADHVVDMGPAAGVHGGYVVAQGTPDEIMQNPRSVTGPWLSGLRALPIPQKRVPRGAASLRVEGARAHNLKNVTVEIPIGLLTCFSGVSGSGKSSLVVDTLLPAVRAELYGSKARVLDADAIVGLEHLDKVVGIDQAPIGRTPRSNPATYTGMFSLLRELFAQVPEARARGYKPGRFSFNVKGGRCEACEGDGVLRVEMHFLPDLFVVCETCEGQRYNRETLEIRYRGMSIADVLAMTVSQAADMFESQPQLRERLQALESVGLGYLTLGQPATTLSGGEAQRVKLARELARRATGRTLYVLDEPTSGLHFADVELLMRALFELRDQGNTVVLIEHNLDVIACADWVVDMGPDGGARGGTVVASGPPELVAREPRSHTGRYLRPVLERPR
jgi:excinuclease ABC subunit A